MPRQNRAGTACAYFIAAGLEGSGRILVQQSQHALVADRLLERHQGPRRTAELLGRFTTWRDALRWRRGHGVLVASHERWMMNHVLELNG